MNLSYFHTQRLNSYIKDEVSTKEQTLHSELVKCLRGRSYPLDVKCIDI